MVAAQVQTLGTAGVQRRVWRGLPVPFRAGVVPSRLDFCCAAVGTELKRDDQRNLSRALEPDVRAGIPATLDERNSRRKAHSRPRRFERRRFVLTSCFWLFFQEGFIRKVKRCL